MKPSCVDAFSARWTPPPALPHDAVPLANGWVGAAGWMHEGALRFDLSHADFWDLRPTLMPDESKCNLATFRKYANPFHNEKLRKYLQCAGLVSNRLPGIALILEGRACRSMRSVTLAYRRATAVWQGDSVIHSRVEAFAPYLVLEGRGKFPFRARFLSALDDPHSSVAQQLRERGVHARRTGKTQLFLIGASRTLATGIVVVQGRLNWCLVAVVVCHENKQEAERELHEHLPTLNAERLRSLRARHEREWNRLMTRSRVSLPERRLEAMYWMQVYQLACAGRGGAPIIGLQGPWAFAHLWPAWGNRLFHNVNVQMSYWSALKTGFHECHQGLKRFMTEAGGALTRFSRRFLQREGYLLAHATDIRGEPSLTFAAQSFAWSSGLWLGQSLDLACRYDGDVESRHSLLVPWLRQCLRALMPELQKHKDGRWHVSPSVSPEYGGVGFRRPIGTDATIDLMFLRWAVEALHRLTPEDEEARAWTKQCRRLARPARQEWVQHRHIVEEKERPFAVFRELPLETSHRHHSHLVSLFPLQRHDPRRPTDLRLMRNCLEELMFRGHGEWVAFSFTWAALLAAHARMPNPALGLLRDFTERYATRNGWSIQGAINDIDFNTHREESWGRAITLEAGLAFPAAVLELLLQDAHGRIEAFPSVPTMWKDAEFENVRTQFGVSVSARMRRGRIQFLRLKFLRDATVTLVNPWKNGGLVRRARTRPFGAKREMIRLRGRALDQVRLTPL